MVAHRPWQRDELLVLSSARGRWVIAATVLGSGIAFLDSTVARIALPSINRTFHGGLGSLQWVVTGYALTLAAFLLLGGSLGDRYGRRRVFSVGIVWFAAASACCGLAPGVHVAHRRPCGPGHRRGAPDAGQPGHPAGVVPARGPARPAIGAWSGLGGVAGAIGPLVGGYLLAVASWRWVFFINLPLAVVVLAVTARHVPESRDPGSAGRVDLPGATLGVAFLAGLTYGLIEAPSRRWSSPAVVASLAVAVVTAPAFLLVEHRRAHPMLPLGLFRARQFSGANAVTFVVYGALGGALFLLPIELQIVAHYSPLAVRAGAASGDADHVGVLRGSGQLSSRISGRACR